MLKKIIIIMAVSMFLFTGTAVLTAQDVIMGSAETIKPGNIKLGIFPMVIFGKNGGESIYGTAGRFGFALSSKSDIEGKIAILKNLKYYGADFEYWLIRNRNINASISLGLHMTQINSYTDSSGIDATFLISTRAKRNLELCLGFKMAFDSKKNYNYGYTLIHIVPGLEYRLNKDLDFLAEFGISLNDDSNSYASIGLALYFQL